MEDERRNDLIEGRNAVNEAMRAADADAAGTMSKLTGGLNLPF